MLIADVCVGCTKCVPYCPSGAIALGRDKKAHIDRNKCIECSVCFNNANCPVNAIQLEELKWPRSVREVFATVYKEHKDTNVPGRGTEEMKTNDVTGRFRSGEVGFSVDMGRPGVGVDLKDAEKVYMELAKIGVEFEPLNPLTFLMSDKKKGKLRDDVLTERVHSCIPEFKIKEEKFPEVLDALMKVAKEINSVFSLGLCVKINPDETVPIMKYLDEHKIYYRPDGKTNIGIGKPAAKF